MKYTGFPIQASVLSGQALGQRLLTRYGLKQPATCNFLHRGVNDTYVVRSGTARYYVRVYRYRWRTKSQIEAEVDMLDYLARKRQPVSRPVRKKNGTYLTRIAAPEGSRHAVVFTEAPGKAHHPYNAARSRQYGELAGRIHACLDWRPVDERRFHLDLAHLIDEPLRQIEPFLQHRRQDLAYLARVGAELKSAMDGLLPRTPPHYGCCHGDHHGYNVHRDEHGRMVLFDFDCYGYGWRAYDVAVFLWQMALQFGWDRAGKARTTRRWNAFLKGYCETRSLTDAELRAVALFVPIRHIWLMGLHSQGAETWGRGFINNDYFDRQIAFIRQAMKHYGLA